MREQQRAEGPRELCMGPVMLCVEYTIGFLRVSPEGEHRLCRVAEGSVLTGLLGERELGTMSLCVARAFARGPGGCAG